MHPLGLQLEDAAVDPALGFEVALAAELLRHLVVLEYRLGDHFALAQQLGDLDPTRGVGRIDVRHLSQQLERLALLAGTVVAVRRGLERVDGLGGETHALVQLSQRLVGLASVRVEVQQLLVDGDGPGVEALLHVLLGDLPVGVDRLGDLPPAAIGVPDLEPELRVSGVQLDELLVFLARLCFGALLSELARVLEDLSLVRRQGPRPICLRDLHTGEGVQIYIQPHRYEPALVYLSVAGGPS